MQHHWEVLYLYCRTSPRWFETFSQYQPSAEHLIEYRKYFGPDWDLRRRGLWFIATPPNCDVPKQGWKIHVSTVPQRSVDVLRTVLPVLRDAKVQFKFLLDREAVTMCGARLWPRGSSGKFIAVYPPDVDVFRRIAEELTDRLRDFPGPYILSDRRAPGNAPVYYRYGGFVGISKLRPDGAFDLHILAPDATPVPDVRHPYWSAPAWVDVDPFGRSVQDDADDDDLLGGRFQVTEAIQFLNRGGVYRAHDTHTGTTVVLKESRPHVVTGDDKYPATCVELLHKEYRLLTKLADTGHFARPIALFTEWEHTFLAEEHVTGRQLSQLTIAENPLYTQDLSPHALASYYRRIQDFYGQLCHALAVAHDRGIVLGDLSWTNVLIEDDTNRLVIIDLEAAVESGVDKPTGMYTPGLSSPRYISSGVPTRADDVWSVGVMLLGAIMLVNTFLGYRPEALPRFLKALAEDLGLPNDLVALVENLTNDPPDAQTAGRRVAELSIGDPAAWPERIPLARPAHEYITGARAQRLQEAVSNAVDDIAKYLRTTATSERDDRLFPADLMVFETNALSVAYGAAGVLHAMHHLSGEVPDNLIAWLLARPISNDEVPPGLYTGQSGVAWVLSELGFTDYAAALLRQASQHPLAMQRHDILTGAAGYGMACLRLWLDTNDPEFLEYAVKVGNHLAACAKHNQRGAYWPTTDHLGTEHVPIGYGHGASGVALFLLYLHLATKDPQPLEIGRAALAFDLSYAEPYGAITAFRGDTDNKRDTILYSYWEQGTAGVITTLVRYRDVIGDQTLDDWITRLLPDLCRKYAIMPQLFRGLAGLGNAILDVADFTGQPHLRAEAWRTAEGVLLYGVDSPEGLGFPGEQAMRESADFATGAAGVGIFLHRLLCCDSSRPGNLNFTLDELLPRYREAV